MFLLDPSRLKEASHINKKCLKVVVFVRFLHLSQRSLPSDVLTRLCFSFCNSAKASPKGKPQGAITLLPPGLIWNIRELVVCFNVFHVSTVGFFHTNCWDHRQNLSHKSTSCLPLVLRPRDPRWVVHQKLLTDKIRQTSMGHGEHEVPTISIIHVSSHVITATRGPRYCMWFALILRQPLLKRIPWEAPHPPVLRTSRWEGATWCNCARVSPCLTLRLRPAVPQCKRRSPMALAHRSRNHNGAPDSPDGNSYLSQTTCAKLRFPHLTELETRDSDVDVLSTQKSRFDMARSKRSIWQLGEHCGCLVVEFTTNWDKVLRERTPCQQKFRSGRYHRLSHLHHVDAPAAQWSDAPSSGAGAIHLRFVGSKWKSWWKRLETHEFPDSVMQCDACVFQMASWWIRMWKACTTNSMASWWCFNRTLCQTYPNKPWFFVPSSIVVPPDICHCKANSMKRVMLLGRNPLYSSIFATSMSSHVQNNKEEKNTVTQKRTNNYNLPTFIFCQSKGHTLIVRFVFDHQVMQSINRLGFYMQDLSSHIKGDLDSPVVKIKCPVGPLNKFIIWEASGNKWGVSVIWVFARMKVQSEQNPTSEWHHQIASRASCRCCHLEVSRFLSTIAHAKGCFMWHNAKLPGRSSESISPGSASTVCFTWLWSNSKSSPLAFRPAVASIWIQGEYRWLSSSWDTPYSDRRWHSPEKTRLQWMHMIYNHTTVLYGLTYTKAYIYI